MKIISISGSTSNIFKYVGSWWWKKEKNAKEKGNDCSLKRPDAMVNFICQLECSMGCPDIGSNIILGVSGKVFFWGGGAWGLCNINMWISRLNKVDCPS